jgi:hypothetical protein
MIKKHLTGHVVAVTGTMSMSRAEFILKLEQFGAKFSKSISKKVTILVCEDVHSGSLKIIKAQKLGINIVSETDIFNSKYVFEAQKPQLDIVVKKDIVQTNSKVPIFAISGRLSKTSKEYGQLIAKHGAVFSSTLTKHVTYLVTNTPTAINTKTQKAKKHGIMIVDEDYLKDFLEGPPVINQQKVGKMKLGAPPSVLLAKKYDLKKHGSCVGWWVSEKYDGVRAWWDGSCLWSRAGNLFQAPQWFLDNLPKNQCLDGELFVDRKKFRETISIVKSHSMSDRWQDIKYMAFDVPDKKNLPFEERMQILAKLCTGTTLVFVDQVQIKTEDVLTDMLKEIENKGGEGLMLRKPESLYIGKRSNSLLKLKSFVDEEARVIGYSKMGKGDRKNMVMSLRLEDKNGVQFDCGSGLTDALRRNPPSIGTVVTFRYFERSSKSARPRFPTFVNVAFDRI